MFPLLGFTFGILICYGELLALPLTTRLLMQQLTVPCTADNNLPENVRCTTLRGAEIILMCVHVCKLPTFRGLTHVFGQAPRDWGECEQSARTGNN